ncbi:MAG: hypothetical protein ACUVXG_06720 [Anaerolineae bacterium]
MTAVCGRFGSGKTEIAINYAVSISNGEQPFLIDLDLVTPYFRSRESAQLLSRWGVRVVAPASVSAHLDTPGITAEILGAIQQQEHPVILDVGGDSQGARALGQYSTYLQQREHEMWFVVNPYRPFTQDVPGVRLSVAEIEASSRLRVTALVSNPNLLEQTTAGLVERGHHLVERAAADLGLPIAFVAVEQSLAPQFADGRLARPVLPLTRYVRVPWEPIRSPFLDHNLQEPLL